MRYSVSSTNLFLKCRKRWSFQYRERLPRPPEAIPVHWRRGTVVHAGIEGGVVEFMRRGSGRLIECSDAAKTAVLKSAQEEDLPPNEINLCMDLVDGALEDHDWLKAADLVSVEEKITAKSPMGAGFIGYNDLAYRQDRTLVLRDHKTRKTTSPPEILANDYQLLLYAWFLRERYPWAQEVKVGHYYPPARTDVTVRAEESAMQEAISRFDAVVEMIEAEEDWDPTPGDYCEDCPFRKSCPAMQENGVAHALEMLDGF